MVDDELKVTGFRKWHDVELQPGGAPRYVTKIRFFIGSSGPFEHVFPRDVGDDAIEAAITKERRSLEQHTRA